MPVAVRLACLLIALLLPFSARANDPCIYLEAASIDYLGDQMVLSGNVCVRHPIGTLSSQRAVLSFALGALELQTLSKLELSDTVTISFTSQDALACDVAYLDFSTLEGTFLGNHEGTLACYRGMSQQGLWELEGEKLSIKLLPLAISNGKKYGLSYLQAEGLVALRTHEGLRALGHRASYLPEYALPSHRIEELGGCFTLLAAADLDAVCKLQDPRGNWIEGKKVLLTPSLGVSTITKPSGCVYMASTTPLEPILLSAEELEWDYREGILRLHRHVQLTHPSLGTAHCDDTVHLWTKAHGTFGHWQVVTLESSGMTEVTHLSLPTMGAGKIQCPGTVSANLLSGNLLFQAAPDKTVLYEGQEGLLSAHRIGMAYHPETSRIEYFFAKQHVHMLRHLPPQGIQEAHQQIALANRLDFFPEKRELLLRGSRSSPALFTDTAQNLSISAHKVVAKLNPDGKESVRGLGAVRLSFNEKEAHHMKHLFSMEP